MKCPRCGTENPINRLYCDECGAELEHDLADIQASVDREVVDERKKANARTIRWFLALSFLLCIIGYYFRRAYRDLPENEIVAFASAPAISIETRGTVESVPFGIGLPEAKPNRPPNPRLDEAAIRAELTEAALARRLVLVRQKNIKRTVEGLLVGDLVFDAKLPDREAPFPIHVADVRHLRPTGANEWEIEAKGISKPVRVSVPSPQTTQVHVLLRRPDGSTVNQPMSLTTIEEIRPK